MKYSASFQQGILLMVQLSISSDATGAISGIDNFNDNVKDGAKWASDRTQGNGALGETGQRLEYTSSGTSYTQNAYRPWLLNKATYDTNWEITLDVTNNAQLNISDVSASVGIEIFSPLTKSLYAGAFASSYSGLPAQSGFECGLVEGSNLFGNSSRLTTGSPGAIRITFNAVTKVLTCYNDADGAVGGYVWSEQASFGTNGSGGTNANTSWGMTASEEFQICIFGYSEGFNVVSGTVFADNFAASSQTTTLVSRPTDITESSALLQGSVYPGGLESSVVFQIATDEEFSEFETTEPQVIPGDAPNTPITRNITGLAPGTNYFVRTKATDHASTSCGPAMGAGLFTSVTCKKIATTQRCASASPTSGFIGGERLRESTDTFSDIASARHQVAGVSLRSWCAARSS